MDCAFAQLHGSKGASPAAGAHLEYVRAEVTRLRSSSSTDTLGALPARDLCRCVPELLPSCRQPARLNTCLPTHFDPQGAFPLLPW